MKLKVSKRALIDRIKRKAAVAREAKYLMRFRLPSGKRVGDATHSEILEAAEVFKEQGSFLKKLGMALLRRARSMRTAKSR